MMISGFDPATPGAQAITVSYGGFSATLTVTVLPKAASITATGITAATSKTSYNYGEAFDLSSLTVTEQFSDGTGVPAGPSLVTISGFDPATPGTQTVTVSYDGFSAILIVTVGKQNADVPVPPGSGITYPRGSGYKTSPAAAPSNEGGNEVIPDQGASTGVAELGYVNPYSDAPNGAWYYNAVKYVTQHGLMVGVGNGKFAPELTMTRAMFAQLLYNYAGKPKASEISLFDDVKNGSWYFDAVTWASGEGIISGYGNGLFGPDDLITREQIAVLLYNLAKSLGLDISAQADLSGYSDADQISDWARPAVQWAVAMGIINGRTQNTIAPRDYATRAEAATLIMQFIALVTGQ